MSLDRVRETYEALGRDDPLYAVLSYEDKREGRWDPEEFFQTGRDEVGEALAYLDRLGVEVKRGAAFDFGCGVGRLTQALCDEFERAVGVDISSTMVEKANEFNRHGERCEYRVNTTSDLGQLEDASFDFVYSNIALQHSPPEFSARYIAEFFRILRPEGVALFHIPSGPRHEPGSLGAALYDLRRRTFRHFWKRIRGRPTVEMHYLHESLVKEIVEGAGGRMVAIEAFGSQRRTRQGKRYCAVR